VVKRAEGSSGVSVGGVDCVTSRSSAVTRGVCRGGSDSGGPGALVKSLNLNRHLVLGSDWWPSSYCVPKAPSCRAKFPEFQ
jgi:hypothetical protein